MGLAVTRSRALRGLSALPVRVETHLANGLPTFTIVGLPEATVRESRDRVRAAIIESGFDFPSRRITVNLAPADLPKDSSRFDLPIAIGVLCAAGLLPPKALDLVELAGELSLSGALRPITGGLAIACSLLLEESPRYLVVPEDTAAEARLSGLASIAAASDLKAVCTLLKALARGKLPPTGPTTPDPDHDPAESIDDGDSRASAPGCAPTPTSTPTPLATRYPGLDADITDALDLDDVIDQPVAKRALEICAAGDHHLLMVGPPGTGKSMLAERLRGIVPRLTPIQAMDQAMIASLRRLPVRSIDTRPPFRAPHHSTSAVGLIGGGQPPSPGEISLAHRGILFLDELPEFRRQALEALREPLETGEVTVTRGPYQQRFPAAFVLVAAMNPCPCGYLGDDRHECQCTPDQVRRYLARLSGPFLDRFDLSVTVRRPSLLPPPERSGSVDAPPAPLDTPSSTSVARRRVADARTRQQARQGCANGRLPAAALDERLRLDDKARRLGERAMLRYAWSMRALHRTWKVARTIADLEGRPTVDADAVAEAIALRHLREPALSASPTQSLPS